MADKIEGKPSPIQPSGTASSVNRETGNAETHDVWHQSHISPSTAESPKVYGNPLLRDYVQMNSIFNPSYGFKDFSSDQLCLTTERMDKAVNESLKKVDMYPLKDPVEWIKELLSFLSEAIEDFNQFLKKKKRVDEEILILRIEILEKEISKVLLRLEEINDVEVMDQESFEELQLSLREGLSLGVKYKTLKILFAPIMENSEARDELANFFATVMDSICQIQEGDTPVVESEKAPVDAMVDQLEHGGFDSGSLAAMLESLTQLAIGKYITASQDLHLTFVQVMENVPLREQIFTQKDGPVLALLILLLLSALAGEIAYAKNENVSKGVEKAISGVMDSAWLKSTLGEDQQVLFLKEIKPLSRYLSATISGNFNPSVDVKTSEHFQYLSILYQTLVSRLSNSDLHKMAKMAVLAKNTLTDASKHHFNYLNIKQ